jgi:hypothetical protein
LISPKPDAAAPPAPPVTVKVEAPPLARTPVAFDVGAVFDDVCAELSQFSHVSPPAVPAVLVVVAPVPPAPTLIYTVALGKRFKLLLESAPPPAPPSLVLFMAGLAPPPPPPIQMTRAGKLESRSAGRTYDVPVVSRTVLSGPPYTLLTEAVALTPVTSTETETAGSSSYVIIMAP